MANQDSSASLLGTMYSNVSAVSGVIGGTIYLLYPVQMNGEMNASSSAAIDSLVLGIVLSGAGSVSSEPTTSKNSGLIDLYATSDLSVLASLSNNTYAAMYGFGSINIPLVGTSVICSDIIIDMNIQEIISIGCTIGESNMISRYRGDTYPVRATLSKGGNYDITGYTFIMSTRIEGQTTYASTGTIIDSANGIVEFGWPTGSVDIVGTGVYDIQGNDGVYIYTYEKGVFELLEDVTV